MGKNHAPSAYRKIIKASKSGKENVHNLTEQARALSDPYYVSLSLFSLSLDKRLKPKDSENLRAEALKLISEENRDWRRAELISSIAKTGKELDISKEIITLIQGIDTPKAMSEAISNSAKYIDCNYQSELLQLSLETQGHEADSAKPVIKHWAAKCKNPESMVEILADAREPELSVKLLGYLQLQFSRSGIRTTEPVEKAVEIAIKHGNPLEMLKYLASQSEDIDSLECIAAAITGLETPLEEAALLTTMAASADKAREKELAIDWFNSAAQCIDEVSNVEETAMASFNLAMGYKRLGEVELADKYFELALKGAADDRLKERIEKAMGISSEKKPKPVVSKSGRHVLALHDTYEGKLSNAHLKMLATAAPLCVAYGLDLALIDFPENDINKLVKKAAADTNIGKGGRYLKELAAENRIILATSEKLDLVGLPVATTSHPSKGKEIWLEKAAKIAGSHPTKRLCVIMGLGKKGLPKKLLDAVKYHAEMTGSNVPLETSTAMGIIAQAMGHVSHPKF